MKVLKIKELTYDTFKAFGNFENMVDPSTEKIDAGHNVDFYRDMMLLNLGQDNFASFSICRVTKRKPVVDFIEYHSFTEESIMPLNGDVAVLMAPAGPKGQVPFKNFKVFRIPSKTMAIINKGVWHSGPFVLDAKNVSILITLPERTYANDCTIAELSKENQVEINIK